MSSVNFLEKLLGGVEVEWMPLGKAAKYSDSRISSTQVNQFNYVGVDNLLQNRAGKINSNYVPSEGRLIEYRKGDILIGNIRPYLKKIWLANNSGGASGDVLVMRSTHKALSSEYLHQVLTDDKFFAYNMQHAKGAKMPRGDKAKILEYTIPIPCPDNPKKSLEIQSEIVRILDAMTAHTAELTAELTARKKQYNYYRDKLLSFEDDVNEFPLSDICTSIADGDHQAPPQTNKGISFVTISNISDNGFIDFSKTKYVPNDYYNNLASKRKPQVGDVLYTVVGSIGIPVFIDFEKEFTFQRHIAILRFKSELVNPKYAFHFIRSSKFFNKANSVAMGAAQKTITLGTLGKLKISLPSLDRQNKVVAILDKFDSLANSITEGLPREIELRQKQYAYYRDLLLSFPKAQAA